MEQIEEREEDDRRGSGNSEKKRPVIVHERSSSSEVDRRHRGTGKFKKLESPKRVPEGKGKG